jgi:FKBP-type peptidyl-prolyl cis-trans isomerase
MSAAEVEETPPPSTCVEKIEIIYEPWSKDRPLDGQVCQINYIMTLANGTVVESSRERRKDVPFSFVLGSTDVIEGLNVAVRMLGQGERSKVRIHSSFAYGKRIVCAIYMINESSPLTSPQTLQGYDGLPPLIPPNAELIVDIELVDFRQVRLQVIAFKAVVDIF